MSKKITGFILSLMMILALIPALPAKAEDPSLRVGNQKIDLTNGGSYMDGKVVYDASAHTLTLDDLELISKEGCCIEIYSLGFDLTIKGSAQLTSEKDSSIYTEESNLILDGDFECYSAYQSSVFIHNGSLTINGGSLYAKYKKDQMRALSIDGLILNNNEKFIVGDKNANEILIAQAGLVKFVNDDEDHTELQSGNVRFGETPQYKGETPTKEADAQYTYIFRGWTDGTKTYGKDETLQAVDGDVKYTAVYDDKINVYSIRFVDEDGTVIKDGAMLYGETPEYGLDKTPAKEADAQYTYTFSGWTDGTETYGKDETLPSVKGDVTYTAVYDKTVNKYDLTFDLGGGTLNGKTGTYTMNCEYGAKINLPDAPTKEGYKFLYWKGSEYAAGAEYTVDGPHDFTAVWEAETKEEAKEQETSPKTGDNNHLTLWVVLMAAALAGGISSLILARRKLKKNR